VIQLQILSGKQAGNHIAICRFPFVLGRAADASARFEESGVWDRHCEITFRRGEGFQFMAQPNAAVVVNGERTDTGLLRNGDLLELGSIQLRFGWRAAGRKACVCGKH